MRTQQGNAIHSRQLLVSVVPLILCCLLIFLCRIIICTEINYKTTHKRPQLSMFCTCFIAMHVGNNIMQCVANLCVHALFGSCHRHEKKKPGRPLLASVSHIMAHPFLVQIFAKLCVRVRVLMHASVTCADDLMCTRLYFIGVFRSQVRRKRCL